MDVLKENFEEVLPIFAAAVKTADFIAIDTELTGLQRHSERQHVMDDVQARYSKLRISASEFLVIQFGVCTFTWSDTQGAFVACPFNFYVFPSGDPREAGDRCFTCSSASMEFLMKCHFDFNKLIRGGIPYMNHTEEDRYKEALEARRDGPDIAINDTNRGFIESLRKMIDDWLQSPNEEKLMVPVANSYLRRLVYQDLEKRYNGFLVANKTQSLVHMEITKLNDDDKRKAASKEKKPILPINFRTIIELIVAAQCPLIGHNCFLDLCQTVGQFWQELPKQVEDWKKLVHGLWDVVIDTKFIALTHPKLQSGLSGTALGQLGDIVKQPPFSEVGPNIIINPTYTRYNPEAPDNAEMLHEAGYDAYVTGMVYLRLAGCVLNEPGNKPPQSVTVNEDIDMADTNDTGTNVQEPKKVEIRPTNPCFRFRTSDQLTQYYNKLHMMRSEIQVVNLLGDEDVILQPKPNYFHVFNIPANYHNSTIYALFKHLEPIHIRWINDTSAWLIIRDDTRIKDVVTGALGLDHARQVLPSGGSEDKSNGVNWEEVAGIQVQSWDQWQERNKKYKSIAADTTEGEAVEAGAVGQDQTEVQHLERATSAPPTNKRPAPETDDAGGGGQGEGEDAEQDEPQEQLKDVDEEGFQRVKKRKRTEKSGKATSKGKRRASANDAV